MAVSRLPCSRPSMSAIASSTVSTVPSATACFSSSRVTRDDVTGSVPGCVPFGRQRLVDVDVAGLAGEVVLAPSRPRDPREQEHRADRERRVVERLPVNSSFHGTAAGVNGRQKMIVINPTQKTANGFIQRHLLPRFQAGDCSNSSPLRQRR